jgi:hypothetical protein
MKVVSWAAIIYTVHDGWTLAALLALLLGELVLNERKRRRR